MPNKAQEIEKCPLGQCIKNYISDDSIRNSSELAAWLRNDQAHYVSRYVEKDVQDLRRLIDYTVKLIESAQQRKAINAEANTLRQSLKSN